MMKIDIVTIFPDFFLSPLKVGNLRIAQEKKLVKIKIHNLRDYTSDPHQQVDDAPFGGGAGMVMKPEPFFKAIFSILKVNHWEKAKEKARIILLTPQGERFNQKMAMELAQERRIVFLCGRYEGIDERVRVLSTNEISIGDFILSGGEAASLVIMESIVRLISGVVGREESLKEETFSQGLLEYPQYTRPADYIGLKVPGILLSGNHREIARWRRKMSLERTYHKRPDLLATVHLTEEDKKLLEEIRKEVEKS